MVRHKLATLRSEDAMRGTDLIAMLTAIQNAEVATKYAIEANSSLELSDIDDLRRLIDAMYHTQQEANRDQVERDLIREMEATKVNELPTGLVVAKTPTKTMIFSVKSSGPAGVRELTAARLFVKAKAKTTKPIEAEVKSEATE